MCECPKGKRCECESFRAYARICAQENIHISWEDRAPCSGKHNIRSHQGDLVNKLLNGLAPEPQDQKQQISNQVFIEATLSD